MAMHFVWHSADAAILSFHQKELHMTFQGRLERRMQKTYSNEFQPHVVAHSPNYFARFVLIHKMKVLDYWMVVSSDFFLLFGRANSLKGINQHCPPAAGCSP